MVEEKMRRKILSSTLIVLFIVSISLALGIPTIAKDESSKEPKFRRSDNPILHLPVDEEKWLPIVPPEPSELPPGKDDDQYMDIEVYDVKTKKVKKTPKIKKSDDQGSSKILGNPGLLTSELITESVIGDDDRVRITPTTTYPWRSICKLFIIAADETGWIGTGFIIDGSHILTAGHCVYMHDHGGWVDSIRVVPAFDDGYTPYWHAWSLIFRTYTGWTNDRNSQHDWAFLTLDRNVGLYTGWMGIMTANPSDPVYEDILHTAGYPADRDGGWCMYWDSDYGEEADLFNHWYYMDTYGGQSGSPVWHDDGSERYVLSIHAYGYKHPQTPVNMGTRIDNTKFDDIISWRSEDTPPTDYANLIDDGQAWSGFDPISVVLGESYFSVWSDIRNIGTADSGIFNVSYFASVDAEITTSDYLIGVDEVTSITPFTWANSSWSGTFPNIPARTYYVGWIIDSTDVVPEPLDDGEGNNVAYKDSPQLVVVEKVISISVEPGNIDFGTIYEGDSGKSSVNITNNGNVEASIEARLESEVPVGFYNDSLKMFEVGPNDYVDVVKWNLVLPSTHVESVSLELTIPYPCPAEDKTAILVFWAEMN